MAGFTLDNMALLLAEAISRKTGADSHQIQSDILAAMVEEHWNPTVDTMPDYVKRLDTYIAYVDNAADYNYNSVVAIPSHRHHLGPITA